MNYPACYSEQDWNILKEVEALLQRFDRATQHISMSRHATISSVVPMYNWIIETLQAYIRTSENEALKNASKFALEKICKYNPTPESRPNLFLATILNPSLKLSYFKEHPEFYGPRMLKQLKDLAISAFKKCCTNHEPGGNNVASPEQPADEFLAHLNKRRKTDKAESEMSEYLTAPHLRAEVDTLKWWELNQNVYPKSTKMALDIFGIQPSSVPMEMEFSGGADLITPKRCRLKSETYHTYAVKILVEN